MSDREKRHYLIEARTRNTLSSEQATITEKQLHEVAAMLLQKSALAAFDAMLNTLSETTSPQSLGARYPSSQTHPQEHPACSGFLSKPRGPYTERDVPWLTP